MATGIGSLPPELLESIFSLDRIHPRDLVRLRLVSRLWNDIIESTPELKYSTELWRDGLLRGAPAKGVGFAELLAKLYGRRNAWRALRYASKTVVPIQSIDDCRAYELIGRHLSLQENRDDKDSFMTLSLDALHASSARGDSVWRSHLGISLENFEDFAIDPGQDLLAFLHHINAESGAVAFRRVSDPAELHADAWAAQIAFPCTWVETFMMTIQILDNIVSVYLHSGFRVLVFDWRRGTMLLDMSVREALDCYFLTPQLFVLAVRSPTANGGKLLLHRITPIPGEKPQLEHIGSLELPPLSVADPTLLALSSVNILAGTYTTEPPAGAPYYQSNDRRILVLGLTYPVPHFLRLVLHLRTLWALVAQYDSASEPHNSAPVERKWGEWGPKEARLLRGGRHHWPRHVHGECIALPVAPPTDDQVQFLDFNVHPNDPHWELFEPKPSRGPGGCETHRESSSVQFSVQINIPFAIPEISSLVQDDHEPGNTSGERPILKQTREVDLFASVVRTSLPYREVFAFMSGSGSLQPPGESEDLDSEQSEAEEGGYDLFLLDEDHIVASDLTNATPEMVVFRMG
ncbi:F-box domain-containing protein [Mycena chlorophos]|uniref:F-box domain-containing protein n=1 Tax=Mycena chlorophos TaxID=658473 RepID=A0A8H6TB07_MYCCL|nr:F-box domain-containing protein [Mycena chlorophos]